MRKLIIIIISSIILVLVLRSLMKRYLPKTSAAVKVRRDKTVASVKAGIASVDNTIAAKVA